jgi:hypothetical protein
MFWKWMRKGTAVSCFEVLSGISMEGMWKIAKNVRIACLGADI